MSWSASLRHNVNRFRRVRSSKNGPFGSRSICGSALGALDPARGRRERCADKRAAGRKLNSRYCDGSLRVGGFAVRCCCYGPVCSSRRVFRGSLRHNVAKDLLDMRDVCGFEDEVLDSQFLALREHFLSA